MSHQQETEAILARTEATLKIVAEQTAMIRKNIERCERDDFPHLPLMSMYKRPQFTEKDC